jgi:hypothetical protein
MALFIAHLAFPAGPLLETAKLAILCGSTLAGVLSLLIGRQILQVMQTPGHRAERIRCTVLDPDLNRALAHATAIFSTAPQ